MWKVGEQEQEREKRRIWDCNEEREKTQIGKSGREGITRET